MAYCPHMKIFVYIVLLSLILPRGAAVEKPKEFLNQIDWEGKKIKDKIDRLKSRLNVSDRDLPNVGCSACTSTEKVGIVGALKRRSALAKTKRLIKSGLRFGNWKDALLSEPDTANTPVTVDGIVPVMRTASLHYEVIATSAQGYQFDESNTSQDGQLPTSTLEGVRLLEMVSSTTAGILHELANAVENNNVVTAGWIYTVVMSVLGMLERVNIRVTSILVGYWNGRNNSEINQAEMDALMDTLSTSNAEGGIFSDSVVYLNAIGDESGLSKVLINAANDVTNITDQLTSFRTTIPEASIPQDETTSNAGTAAMIQDRRTLNLFIATIGATLYIVYLFGVLINAILSNTILFVLGFGIALIDLIIGVNIENLGSALDIYMAQQDTGIVSLTAASSPNNAVSNAGQDDFPDTSLFLLLILFYILSPITFVIQLPIFLLQRLICFVTGNDPCKNKVYVNCQIDAILCQSDALSTALLSL